MTVVILRDCPSIVAGFLSRWMLEMAPCVLVGRLTRRQRDHLWRWILAHRDEGHASMAWEGGDFPLHLTWLTTERNRFQPESVGLITRRDQVPDGPDEPAPSR